MVVSLLKGSYVLVLRLGRRRNLAVGRLGTLSFSPGYYLYFGSALNGLEGRVRRHLRREKKPHWHVDALTSVATPHQVWWTADMDRWECAWAGRCVAHPAVTVPVAGFGSSDCRCPAHLVRVADGAAVEELRPLLAGECSLEVYVPRAGDGGFCPQEPSRAR